MEGFIIVDKPAGISSQQLVTQVRKAFGKIKAGHTGTLDPLATGVLPVALGEATKVISFLDESHKTYWVQAELGISTTTYDAEGEVVERGSIAHLTSQLIQSQLEAFRGEQQQHPPSYSAVKWKGKPLYAYARQGKEFKVSPRQINIEHLQFETWIPPFLRFEVTCSRGTYIRSLVHDLGIKLGCFAHVNALRRLKTGSFDLSQTFPLKTILESPQTVFQKILSIEYCLASLPQLFLDSATDYRQIKSGISLSQVDALKDKIVLNQTVALVYQEKIIALVKGEEGKFVYQRVLNRN